MKRQFIAVACILLTASCWPRTASGESISLTDAQRKKLIEIVRSDPEAGQMFEKLKHQADEALADRPNPIDKIQSEGKLPADPARLKTRESLKDMPRMDALGCAYAVTGKPEYAAKARQFVLAWAKVNHSAGDPIDDTNLESLLVAYDLTRDTFSHADRETTDAYLREVAAREQESAKKHKDSHHNNWHSHRLKVLGLIAFVLHEKSLIDHVAAAYKDQIDHNILPDGSTYDFHERDALHYHIYDLTPLLTLAIAARNNGIDLYSYRSPRGSSLGKGVAFLVPFADGEKVHAEFVHSKVAFDRKRAEAGDEHYRAGRSFEPRAAVSALERAELFDPSLLKLVIKLAEPGASKYPTWQTVLNEARR